MCAYIYSFMYNVCLHTHMGNNRYTRMQVLLFAAILVVIAALEQELMELLELCMALKNK